MRLRRETGDFNIVLAINATTNAVEYTARTNLPAENFVGEIVKDTDGNFNVITKVTPTETGATLVAGELTLSYVKATGQITVVTPNAGQE